MLKNTRRIFEDILDDEFIDIFKPIFYFLSLFGMRGVTIEYKFVTPPTILYKTYCCVIWVVSFACVFNCVIRCNSRFDAQSTDIPLKTGILMNCCINAFLAWKSVFYSGDKNSQLYVKLQLIERVLKMKDCRKINKRMSKMTAVSASIGFLASLAFALLFNLYLIEGFCPTATVALAVTSMSYFETFLVFTMLYFITVRARYVNEMLSQNGDCFRKDSVYFTSQSVLERKEMCSDELVRGLYSILDSMADILDVFQHAVIKTD